MTEDIIREAMMKLQGAVTIVYPMNLPPHDPIRLEFEGTEDLRGTQVILIAVLKNPLWLLMAIVVEMAKYAVEHHLQLVTCRTS